MKPYETQTTQDKETNNGLRSEDECSSMQSEHQSNNYDMEYEYTLSAFNGGRLIYEKTV